MRLIQLYLSHYTHTAQHKSSSLEEQSKVSHYQACTGQTHCSQADHSLSRISQVGEHQEFDTEEWMEGAQVQSYLLDEYQSEACLEQLQKAKHRLV